MAAIDDHSDAISAETSPDPVQRGIPSAFEKLITDQPPVLQSLIAQLPTQSILALYHTSSYLNNFFQNSPTSWRHISWRLYQPAPTAATPTNNGTDVGPRQIPNYGLDQLLLFVIHPFSTRLASLELDNTTVSGSTLFPMVMLLRRDTLEHVSVRGCKNVSLKYHINPWLMMHLIAMDGPKNSRAPGYEKLALKSLYTYRCRHHRRRPYLPSSLARKESDSEPTHELVLACHKLGIWTDTAWCTTPGGRCFRRRGYISVRITTDTREVWVVYDRLWRSRNWLGPIPDNRSQAAIVKSRTENKRDCRSWEYEEEAMNGESIATKGEGKAVPAHLRKTHKQFVENVYCDNCSDPILERCEQCSVMMHCSGCRKTLCASCAFDRPYLRNKNAADDEKNKFWWAPGCAVSPCSMQDQDPIPAGNGVPNQTNNGLPNIKFRWCCTEPIFSGGGGITFGVPQSRETDRVRAAPLPAGQGWEDPEFSHRADEQQCDVFGQVGVPLTRTENLSGPGKRWPTIDYLFRNDRSHNLNEPVSSVPRILCDECYQTDQWRMKCKACSVPLCLKHDVQDRLKVRLCGYRDLAIEKTDYEAKQKAKQKAEQKAIELLRRVMIQKHQKNKKKALQLKNSGIEKSASTGDIADSLSSANSFVLVEPKDGLKTPQPIRASGSPDSTHHAELDLIRNTIHPHASDTDVPNRPGSPGGSNSTGPPSRASSPTPSARSTQATPEPKKSTRRSNRNVEEQPKWKGCQSFFCPSTRVSGDHRRRCIAIMRQCTDCKIYVCEQCTAGLEAPCPCKGCRVPTENGQNDVPSEANLRFFCPNCRWSRMMDGKCKRKPISMSGKSNTKKRTRNRPKKPIEERRGHARPNLLASTDSTSRDIADGLVEFFEGLQVHNANETTPPDPNTATVSEVTAPGEEIRELEDMGALARDLIRRIQTLRQQFGPNSVAALALPDIRVDDNGNVQQHVPTQTTQAGATQTAHSNQQQQAQSNGETRASSSGSGA